MASINVLVFIHGMPVEAVPGNHTDQYTAFYDVITTLEPAIKTAIPFASNVAMIEWGHAPLPPHPGPLLNDEKLTDAENSILANTGVDNVKQFTGPDNTFLGLTSDIAGRIITRPIIKPIKDTLFTLGMTDVLYYTSPDGEHAVRQHVYGQFFDHLDQFSGPTDIVRIHIISHSQGATVAFDFLFGLFASAIQRGNTQPGFITDNQFLPGDDDRFNNWRGRAQTGTLVVGSFSTFGSQLALAMMRKQRVVDMLSSNPPMLLDPTVIGVPTMGPIAKWKHFYDTDDVLGYPVRHLFNCQTTVKEYEVDSNWSPTLAHSNYWICPQVQKEIAELMIENL